MKSTKATPERLRIADRLKRRGMSFKAIGEVLDVSGTTVRAWLDRDYAAQRRGDRREVA